MSGRNNRWKAYSVGYAGQFLEWHMPVGKRFAKKIGRRYTRRMGNAAVRSGVAQYYSDIRDDQEEWELENSWYDYEERSSYFVHEVWNELCVCDNCIMRRDTEKGMARLSDNGSYCHEEYSYKENFYNRALTRQQQLKEECLKWNESDAYDMSWYYHHSSNPEHMWAIEEHKKEIEELHAWKVHNKWLEDMDKPEWYMTDDEKWGMRIALIFASRHLPDTNPFSVLPHYAKRG